MDSFNKLHDSCNLCGKPLAAHNNDVNAGCPRDILGWVIIAVSVVVFVYVFFGAAGWL